MAAARKQGRPSRDQECAAVAAARAGDQVAFTELAESCRRELHVHCYRMLGSFEDAEDLVQETFLRAWHKRGTFDGRSTFRAWLYRIATNACLDFLDRSPRWPETVPTTAHGSLPQSEITWLQPYPDHLLEPVAPNDTQPDAAAVANETIELAFLAAIQYLPPRQRAVLILRAVVGWSASETAVLLDSTVPSVNSALQRARATLRVRLPNRRTEWAPSAHPSAEERAVLRRYMDATRRADLTGLAAVLRDDARFAMPPTHAWYNGRDAIIAAWTPALVGPGALVDPRHVVTRANRQPAVATYVRPPGVSEHRPVGMHVLRIEGDLVVEVTAFPPALFPVFDLPATL